MTLKFNTTQEALETTQCPQRILKKVTPQNVSKQVNVKNQ